MLLPDHMIRQRLRLPDGDPRRLRISDFQDYGACPEGAIGYGLCTAGYDVRFGYRFLLFKNTSACVVDVKNFRREAFEEIALPPVRGTRVVLPPNCFCLAETLERFRVPSDCCGQLVGKSTYARGGYVMATTPLEPGWEGVVTLEVGNLSPLPMYLYAGEGAAQAQFQLLACLPEHDYANKPRKHYMGQNGLTPPVVSGVPAVADTIEVLKRRLTPAQAAPGGG